MSFYFELVRSSLTKYIKTFVLSKVGFFFVVFLFKILNKGKFLVIGHRIIQRLFMDVSCRFMCIIAR